MRGVLLQEGRAARRRREVFAPGSVQWPTGGVGILTRHRGAPEVRAIPEREPDGRIVIEAPATDRIREAVASGRRFMSVEFRSMRERRTEGGIREILSAFVDAGALVQSPEYAQTTAEVRRRLGRSMSSRVRTGRRMDCACPGGDCEEIEFEENAFADVPDQVVATAGPLHRVVGNAALTPSGTGLGIAVDLLDTAAARDLTALISGGVAVYGRPLIDLEESETEESEDRNVGNVLRVRKAVFSAVLFKPVAKGVAGLDPVTLGPEDRHLDLDHLHRPMTLARRRRTLLAAI